MDSIALGVLPKAQRERPSKSQSSCLPIHFLLHKPKVFAEINTLQAKLDILHTLFMQHRFQISSPSAKRISDHGLLMTRTHGIHVKTAWLRNSRLACPKRERPTAQQNPDFEKQCTSHFYIKANAWVDYTRDWFSSSGPYPPGSVRDLGSATVRQEIENYFQAIVNTCNHQDWPDGAPRWSPNSRKTRACCSSIHLLRRF